MKQNHYVLPERCVRCGAVFDLWYDLLTKSESSREEGNYEVDEFLCWNCRQIDTEGEIYIEIEPITEEEMRE